MEACCSTPQMNWWHWDYGKKCEDTEQNRALIHFKRVYGTARQGTIIGLNGGDMYWVTVQVMNGAGLSGPSGCNYLLTNDVCKLMYERTRDYVCVSYSL